MVATSTSLYYKIYRDLQYKIGTGELAPGSVLPTDAELEKIYGVSRSPIRQALECLKNEGLIVRRAGCRTSVAEKKRSYPWLSATGYTGHYLKEWQRTTVKTFTVEFALPFQEAALFLGIPEGRQAIHIKQVRYLDDEPVYLNHFYLRVEEDIELFRKVGDFMSIKELFFSQKGQDISLITESLAVQPLSPEDAPLINLKAGDAALQIYQYCYGENQLSSYFNLRYARSDRWRYEANFVQHSNAHPTSFSDTVNFTSAVTKI